MKKILQKLAAIAFFSMLLPVMAYGGTWYGGSSFTFYSGTPGNCGAEIDVTIKVNRRDEYRAELAGKKLKGQWLGFRNLTYSPDKLQWCYFLGDESEAMGWTEIDGNWYNFGGGGSMLTGWHRTDGNYYYFDPVTGIMQTSGTAVREGITYEFQPNGLSKKIDGLFVAEEGGTDGWIEEDGEWYYLRDGQKVTNEWLKEGDLRYYVGENGAMYTGSHIIDGCLYMFSYSGRLMMDGGFTYSNGVKYVFDGTGRGVPSEMDADERMKYSASTVWCGMTYEIYNRSEKMAFWEARDREKIWEGLKRQWGVTNRDECIAMIQKLFANGVDAQDKAEKAWDFSRAMMLCETGYRADWWEVSEQVNMQIAMAPVIQQSFTSWEEFNASYMSGFTSWSGGRGETYERRKKAYDSYLKYGSSHTIDWNIPIEKTW